MKRGLWGDDPEHLMDNSDHGVIRVTRLLELGVPSRTIYRRCGPDGTWQRLLPGVVSLYRSPMTREQRIASAKLYGGPVALVTGNEACRIRGLRNVPSDEFVHLLVPHGRRLHNYGHVLVERTLHLPPAHPKDGVAMAPITRALLDGARRMTDLRPVRALLTEAVQRSYTTVERLVDELGEGSQRGSAVPRRVLMEMGAWTHSVAEVDAHNVWSRSGLPVPVWNRRLVDASGKYLGKPDAWFDDVALAWEIDSLAFHFETEGYAKTLARNVRYASAGVLVVQTLPSRLRTEPEKVIAELRAAYRAAADRPRPVVRLA